MMKLVAMQNFDFCANMRVGSSPTAAVTHKTKTKKEKNMNYLTSMNKRERKEKSRKEQKFKNLIKNTPKMKLEELMKESEAAYHQQKKKN